MLGIAAALAFSQCVTVAHLPSRPSAPEPNATRNYHQAQAQKPAPGRESEKSSSYDPDCANPKDREDANLCEQRRMAEAAEKTVALADSQFWWNIAQAVGTILAAGAAAYAAWAAGRAVSVASRNAQSELRAYIFVTPVRMQLAKNYGIGRVELEIRNSGHTPAKNLSLHFKARVLPFPLPGDFNPGLEDLGPSGLSVGPQTAITPPMLINSRAAPEEVDNLKSGKFAFYVFLAIYYTDVFNGRHATKVCFSPETNSLLHAFAQGDAGTSLEGVEALWLLHHHLCSSD